MLWRPLGGIGGCGADRVTGGSRDDTVIGGTTNYDANDLALMSRLAEWQSGNSYSVRISHLKNGGGLNVSHKLIFGTTVQDDGAAKLTAAENLGPRRSFAGPIKVEIRFFTDLSE